jgi:hypothetical protein
VKPILALFALLLLGNTAPVADPIPDALKPYIVDSELKTDDFGWMRGAFDGASEQQKADWQTLEKWTERCAEPKRKAMITELAEMGVGTELGPEIFVGPLPCWTVVSFQPLAKLTQNWDEFTVLEAKAREVFLIYKHGGRIAAQHAPYETSWGNEEAWDLLTVATTEQLFRRAFSWEADEKAPKLDPAIMPYFKAYIRNAVGREDERNTEFLKKLVADKGWPTISNVGPRASSNAWLLVQHADHDPVFQLKALRLMEPLAARGEVSKRNYAYLYDRIMLKLNGKQRFGTQFGGCDGSAYKLRPLEDEANVEVLRKSHDLEPLGDYGTSMAKNFGPCKEN